MFKREYTEVKIPCALRLIEGSTYEHCKECNFFNGEVEKDNVKGVDCLYNDMPSFRCHITSFKMNGKHYKTKIYDPETDGKIPYDDEIGDEDMCKLCCFNKMLDNGKEVCLLRCGVNDEMIDSFMCYDDEFWVEDTGSEKDV